MSKVKARQRETIGTREAILDQAMDIASAEGLEGVTIGRLAGELKMSKSGLFAHFGSKEELQLATVNAAREVFEREIVRDAFRAEEGLARLHEMLERWIQYVERRVFRGGCFFAAASAEFDGRPGRVRDLIVELTGAWLQAIEDQIQIAVRNGELASAVDPSQLAFELHALVQEANWAHELLDRQDAFQKARIGIRDRLAMAAPRSSRKNTPLRRKRR